MRPTSWRRRAGAALPPRQAGTHPLTPADGPVTPLVLPGSGPSGEGSAGYGGSTGVGGSAGVDPSGLPGAVLPESGHGSWLLGRLAGRGPLVGLLALLAVLVGAGAGYLALSGPGADSSSGPTGGDAVTGAVRPAPTATAVRSANPTTAAAASSAPPTGTRNPFGDLAGVSTPSGTPGAGGSTSPSSTAGSGTGAVTGPSGSPSIGTTVVVTSTATVTPPPAVYLGLYGWTAGGLPRFWVDDTAYTPTAGSSFATTFRYVSPVTVNGQTCADITRSGTAQRLCPGQVVKES